MSLRAGDLRHRITIQRPIYVQDPATGGMVRGWDDVATVWGRVAPLSVREFVAAQAIASEVTARITIRYRPDVTAKCRILYRGKIYNIRGVLSDPESGLEYLTLPVSEGVNSG